LWRAGERGRERLRVPAPARQGGPPPGAATAATAATAQVRGRDRGSGNEGGSGYHPRSNVASCCGECSPSRPSPESATSATSATSQVSAMIFVAARVGCSGRAALHRADPTTGCRRWRLRPGRGGWKGEDGPPFGRATFERPRRQGLRVSRGHRLARAWTRAWRGLPSSATARSLRPLRLFKGGDWCRLPSPPP
jgi:hypothetical protein